MTYTIDNIRHNVIEKINSITDDYVYIYPELFDIPTYNSGKGYLLLNGITYVDGSIYTTSFKKAQINKKKKGLLIITERYRMHQYDRIKQTLKLALGNFDIVVIHQNNDNLFNKSILINIAFLECMKETKTNEYEYIIIHDIDMFANIKYDLKYTNSFVQFCGILEGYDKPSRSRSSISGKPYHGGITIINCNLFEKINGMNNLYTGWGYEDTDLIKRLNLSGNIGTVRYGEFDCPANLSDRSNYSENSTLIADSKSSVIESGLSNLNKVKSGQDVINIYDYDVVYNMIDSDGVRNMFVHFIDHKNMLMIDYNNKYRKKYLDFKNSKDSKVSERP